MPDMFTGSPGDASAMVEQWRQFFEDLLRSEKRDAKKKGLAIYSDQRLVYGIDSKTQEFKDEMTGVVGGLLNPDLLEQLKSIQATCVGGVVPEAKNKRIELDGKVILQYDSKGQVLINEIYREIETEIVPEDQLLPSPPLDVEKSVFEDQPLPSPPLDVEEPVFEDQILPELPLDVEKPVFEDEPLPLPPLDVEEPVFEDQNLPELPPEENDDWLSLEQDQAEQSTFKPQEDLHRITTNLERKDDLIPNPDNVNSNNTALPNPQLLAAFKKGIATRDYTVIASASDGIPYRERQRVYEALSPEEQKESRLLKLIHQVEELTGINDGSIQEFVRHQMRRQGLEGRRVEQQQPQSVGVSIPRTQTSPAVETRTSGYERVRQNLAALPQTSSVQIADAHAQTMQLLLATMQQQAQQMRSLHEELAQIQQLVSQRQQQPKQISWWEKTKQMVTTLCENFTRREEHHTYAYAVRQLYAQIAPPNTPTVYAANYTIHRESKHYTLSDQNGRTLMKFRANGWGVNLEETPRLQETHRRDLAELFKAQMQRRQPQEGFAIAPTQEADYFLRVQQLSDSLINYAKSQNRLVEVDGKFSYKWKATPNGEVEIWAKDGRGAILAGAGGKVVSQLADRDLAFFESILPKLRSRNVALTVSPSSSRLSEQKKSKDNEIGA